MALVCFLCDASLGNWLVAMLPVIEALGQRFEEIC